VPVGQGTQTLRAEGRWATSPASSPTATSGTRCPGCWRSPRRRPLPEARSRPRPYQSLTTWLPRSCRQSVSEDNPSAGPAGGPGRDGIIADRCTP